MTKFCTDCRHFESNMFGMHGCKHPDAIASEVRPHLDNLDYLVTGEQPPPATQASARVARMAGGVCGLNGDLWEDAAPNTLGTP